MPNWTTITIQRDGIGNEDLFDKHGNFDFNKLIPQPKTKEECIKCGEEYICSENSGIEIDGKRPWFNWYNWNNSFWGTKWNACYTDKNKNSVSFNTAWSEPTPILEALAGKYKNNMSISYEYEEGYVGKYEVVDGELEEVYAGELCWKVNEDGEYESYVVITDGDIEQAREDYSIEVCDDYKPEDKEEKSL